jgi:hypothetical protein
LALLIERKDHRADRRIDVEADHVLELLGNLGSLESLKVQMRCELVNLKDAHRPRLMPAALASIRPVQWWISAVPQPSAVARIMLARHTWSCCALRSATIASSRRRCDVQAVWVDESDH